MGSNLKINKVCKQCGKKFIAKMTTTRYCSHPCAQKAYYERIKAERLSKQKKQDSIEEVNLKEILTVKEVARLLECSTKTIYRLIDKGTIKAVNLSNRMTRIKRDEIDEILRPKQEKELLDFNISNYYTMKELRNRFSISDKAIYEIIKREQIKKVKIGKHIYIPKQPIDNIL
ncbi:MAG: helix-turn-helix domain-containing protein [Cytophagales bacterium]|nr:helix-turn-helix domain-containing protein [Cytophagales bacterium]